MPILAIDQGTSSVRAAVFDESSIQILQGSLAQEKYVVDREAGPGASELNPKTVKAAAERVILAALEAWPEAEIRAVGFSSMWHSLLAVDVEGEPLGPCLTWEDARPATHLKAIRDELGGDPRAIDDLFQKTGAPLDRTFWLAKIRWYKAYLGPEKEEQVWRWMGLPEWLQLQWTRVAAVSVSMASGTGLLSRELVTSAPDWNLDAVELSTACGRELNPISDFNEVADVTFASGRVDRLCGVPWASAIGDGAAGNLGSGAADGQKVAMNFGTSAAVRLCGEFKSGPDQSVPEGLFAYRLDGKRSLIGGAVNNAGNIHAWLLRTLQLPDDLDDVMADRPCPLAELRVAPFLGGERSPFWDPNLSGAIDGLRFGVSALDLYQAFIEAVFYHLSGVLDRVTSFARDNGVEETSIIVSGGLAQSSQNLTRLANIIGRPLDLLGEKEASLRGAAVFAAEHLGYAPPPPEVDRVQVPYWEYHEIYQPHLRAHREFVRQKLEALSPVTVA